MEARKIGGKTRVTTSHVKVMNVVLILVENIQADIKLAWYLLQYSEK